MDHLAADGAQAQMVLSADDAVAALGSSLVAASNHFTDSPLSADPTSLYVDAALDLATQLRPPDDDGVLCFHPDRHVGYDYDHYSPCSSWHCCGAAHATFSADSTVLMPGPADRLLCALVPHAVVAEALAAYITRRFLPRSTVDVGPWLGSPMSSALPRSVLTAVPLAHAQRLAARWRRRGCANSSRNSRGASSRECDPQEDARASPNRSWSTDEADEPPRNDADEDAKLEHEDDSGDEDAACVVEGDGSSSSGSCSRAQQPPLHTTQRKRARMAETAAGHSPHTEQDQRLQQHLELLCDVFPHEAITAFVAEVPQLAPDQGLDEEEEPKDGLMHLPVDRPLRRWVRLQRLAELWCGFGRTLTADAVAALVDFQQCDPDSAIFANDVSSSEPCLVSAAVGKIRGLLASLATECSNGRWQDEGDRGSRCALCEANYIDPSSLRHKDVIWWPSNSLTEWRAVVHTVLLLVSIGDAGRRGDASLSQLLSTLAERAQHNRTAGANDNDDNSTQLDDHSALRFHSTGAEGSQRSSQRQGAALRPPELTSGIDGQEGRDLSSVRPVVCDPAASATAMARALSHVTHRCPLTAAALGAAGLLDTVTAVTVDEPPVDNQFASCVIIRTADISGLHTAQDHGRCFFQLRNDPGQSTTNAGSGGSTAAVFIPPSTTWLRIGNDGPRVDFTLLQHLTTLEVAGRECDGRAANLELVAAVVDSCPQLHTLRLAMTMRGRCGGCPSAPEKIAASLHPDALTRLKPTRATDADIFQKLSADESLSTALVVLGLWKITALTSLALRGSINNVHANAGLAYCIGLKSLYVESDCSTTVPPLPNLTALELSGNAKVADLALFPALQHFTGDNISCEDRDITVGSQRQEALSSPPPLLSYAGGALSSALSLTSLTRLHLTESRCNSGDLAALANLRHLEHVWLDLLPAPQLGAAWRRTLRTCTFQGESDLDDRDVVPFIVALGPQSVLRSLALRDSDVSSFSIAAAAVCLPQLRSLFVATESISHPDDLCYLATTIKAATASVAAVENPTSKPPQLDRIKDVTGMMMERVWSTICSMVEDRHSESIAEGEHGGNDSASHGWFPALESLVLEGVVPSDRFLATICGSAGCQRHLKRFAFGARGNTARSSNAPLTVESFTEHLPRLIALRNLVMLTTSIRGIALHTEYMQKPPCRYDRGPCVSRKPMAVLEVTVAEGEPEHSCHSGRDGHRHAETPDGDGGHDGRGEPEHGHAACPPEGDGHERGHLAEHAGHGEGDVANTPSATAQPIPQQPATLQTTRTVVRTKSVSCIRCIPKAAVFALAERLPHLAECVLASDVCEVTGELQPALDHRYSKTQLVPEEAMSSKQRDLNEIARMTRGGITRPTADSAPSVANDSAAFERSELPWRPLLTARGPRPIRPDGRGLWDPVPMVYRSDGDNVVFQYENDDM